MTRLTLEQEEKIVANLARDGDAPETFPHRYDLVLGVMRCRCGKWYNSGPMEPGERGTRCLSAAQEAHADLRTNLRWAYDEIRALRAGILHASIPSSPPNPSIPPCSTCEDLRIERDRSRHLLMGALFAGRLDDLTAGDLIEAGRAVESERDDLKARLDADERADLALRTQYEAKFGLVREPGDTCSCWDEIVEAAFALGTRSPDAPLRARDARRQAFREAATLCETRANEESERAEAGYGGMDSNPHAARALGLASVADALAALVETP